ncbi:MFS general substrate transporter [Backusella circina FSU 941]|nr:MFS general substrate transporter [Backusella circina FSU 941]
MSHSLNEKDINTNGNDFLDGENIHESNIIKQDDDDDYITPPDGGRGCFGYNYSWGVFLNYYKTNVYVGQMSLLSWIGSICVSLFFIIGPINQLVIQKMGYKYMLATGTVLCSAALILASFAHEVWQVFLSQGVLFGIGASFVAFPCMGAPQQWFSERRGLAVGLAFCGSGVGGLVISNICNAIIKNLGYQWALRIVGIMTFVLLSIATCLVRPFGDVRKTGGRGKIISWYLFKNPMFTVMFFHGLITTFGYMTPFFLLPSHAQSLHLNSWVGTNLSAIMSAVNAVARVFTGYIGDKFGRFNSLFICTFMCGVCCLTIWTNVHNEATLWVFAILYGFFGGGYVALFPAVQPQVVGLENISPAIGLLYTTNLFGYLFGTPIATALINTTTPPSYLYGALWAGSTIIVGSLFAGWLRILKGGFKFAKI